MTNPPQVIFHGVDRSDAVEEHVCDKVAKLAHLHPEIMSCRVTIELPHKHQHHGKHFDVRIDLTVPGREIAVNRDTGNEDMYIALRDAFDAAKHQLDSHAREHRGDGRRHDEADV